MLGYALFLVPMFVAFVWIRRKWGVKQALLDLLAFNLWFDFGFAALLPNNIQLSLVHILMLLIISMESIKIIALGRVRLRRSAIVVLVLVSIFLFWMTLASFWNKMAIWGVGRVINYVVRGHVLTTLPLVVVGILLAKERKLERFGKIFIVTSVLVGILSLVQVASRGRLLTSDFSPNYLGVFQPQGDKQLGRLAQREASLSYVSRIRTIHFAGTNFYRASGPFEGSAIMLCVVALVTLYLLTSKKNRSSYLLFIPLALAVAGMVAAFGRTIIGTFLLIAVGVIIVRLRYSLSPAMIRRWIAPVLLALLICFIFIRPIYVAVAANLDGIFGERGERQVASLNGRTVLWKDHVLPEIWQHPLFGSPKPITFLLAGWGGDNTADVDISTHNSFLEYAYRGGLIPAILYTVIYGFYIVRSFRLACSKNLSYYERTIFSVLFINGVALFVIQQMTTKVMSLPQISALFWIPCGYVAAYIPAKDTKVV